MSLLWNKTMWTRMNQVNVSAGKNFLYTFNKEKVISAHHCHYTKTAKEQQVGEGNNCFLTKNIEVEGELNAYDIEL